MTTPLPWIKRTFSFDFPVGWYPDVVERFRGMPARAEDRVRRTPPALLTRRDGETWSIQENLGHLLDLEELFQRRISEFQAGAAVLSPADMANRATHEARHNDRPVAEILQALRRERERAAERLDGLAEADFARTSLHPRLRTPMRLVDAVCFACCHDDYHLARCAALARLFGRPA